VKWEKDLQGVGGIAAISNEDYEYFSRVFPDKNVIRTYGFNALDKVESLLGKGKYVLFHGNLSVAENKDIAAFIMGKIAPITDCQFIIAGKNPTKELIEMADGQKNIKMIANPSEFKMQSLITDAHIHLMLTYQATGFKLKLITSIFNGRFVIANDEMLKGSGLDGCVIKANSAEEIMSNIHKYKELPFDEAELNKRKSCISEDYFNRKKAQQIIELL